ncbi:hypothetical protein J6590_020473 [Homalodisca vitripennis]|nr:hypothetical protein J6590_020473 [Homalodisca vitripennis]
MFHLAHNALHPHNGQMNKGVNITALFPLKVSPLFAERDRTPAALSLSKSCEDLSQKEQLAPSVLRALEPRGRSGRKFTFQSTVRQIERRRLAEKLSKEAEQKERQRLNELEAMRRVEEEFQRKREREKADIRHQLRLYSLTQGRAQPDGVDAPPPPATQVLSEFRQPRRDYRDYTPHRFSHSYIWCSSKPE